MAGGLRISGNSVDGMVTIRVPFDTEYDLVQIAERFEVPYMEIKSKGQGMAYYAMVEGTARSIGKHAIETYERLRHWRYYSSRPPVLDVSEAQYDLDTFRSSSNKSFTAINQGSNIDSLGTVAYVIKLWFIVPKIRTEVITSEKSDPDVTDGLVNPHNITNFVPLPDSKYKVIPKDI